MSWKEIGDEFKRTFAQEKSMYRDLHSIYSKKLEYNGTEYLLSICKRSIFHKPVIINASEKGLHCTPNNLYLIIFISF